MLLLDRKPCENYYFSVSKIRHRGVQKDLCNSVSQTRMANTKEVTLVDTALGTSLSFSVLNIVQKLTQQCVMGTEVNAKMFLLKMKS
jgi:hypothetical protein